MNRVPVSTRSRTDNIFQLSLAAAAVIASILSIRPLGISGLGGLVLALLALNSLFVGARLIPTGAVPYRVEFAMLLVAAFTSAGLLSIESLSVTPIFAYLLVGRAGYLLAQTHALVMAGLTGALSSLGLLIVANLGYDSWPWLLGLTTAMPVFLGMANRNRDLAIQSALDAAESAQRAAASEATALALAERARISRDVHDVLAHSLSSVSMQLQLGDMYLEAGNVEGAREALSRAHSLVREGMTEARRAVQDSRAEVLPLDRTLASLFTGAADVRISGNVVELPPEITQALVRVAQESLTNARRHAAGAALDVELRYDDAFVELKVVNAAPDEASTFVGGSGMGLVGMRERVALLDGTAEIGPILDGPFRGGWRVAVRLPV